MESEGGPKSAIVFEDIPENYIPENDIICVFLVSTGSAFSIHENCWVGLFRVGWEKADEFVTREFVTKACVEDSEEMKVKPERNKFEIRFSAKTLPPANDTDFYQFCFITGDGNVIGASCPFVISAQKNTTHLESIQSGASSTESSVKKSENEELEWCPWLDASEEIDDALIVHSKTTLLEKSLAKVVEENGTLREALDEKELENEKLRSELEDKEKTISKLATVVLERKKQQDNDLKWIEELQEKQVGLEEDKKFLEEQIRYMKGVIANLEEQKSDLRKDMDLLSKDLHLARGKELQKVCQGYEERLAQSAKVISDLEYAYRISKDSIAELKIKHKEELSNMSKSFDGILMQLNAQCSNVENVESQKRELLKKIESMTQSFMEERKDLIDQIELLNREVQRLAGKESSKAIQLQQDLQSSLSNIVEAEASVRELQLALSDKCRELAEAQDNHDSALHRKNSELLECQMELRHVISELDAVKGENSLLREKCNGHNGARHALQIAYKHTQKQLSSLKEDHETLSQKYQSLSQESRNEDNAETVKELKDKVEDLKIRLCIGANAYREKVLQCRLLQKELKKCNQAPEQADESKVSENASTSSTQEAKQAQNGGSLAEMMIIVGKLKAEINVKEEMVKELQKKLKSSEETFKRSLQGMTAEIVSLKKNLKEKDDEISSLHPKLIAHPASALSSVASYKATSEIRRTPYMSSTKSSQALPPFNEHDSRIFYPPTYVPKSDGSSVERCNSPNGVARGVLLARGAVVPSAPSDEDITRLESRSPVNRSEQSCNPKISTGQRHVRSMKAVESCPVCHLIFPLDTSEVTATNHVNLHFETDTDS